MLMVVNIFVLTFAFIYVILAAFFQHELVKLN